MKKLLVVALILNSFINSAQVLSGPESLEWDEANTRWLVGNSSGGTILTRSTSGVLSNFVTGIPSGPYGIEILGNKVFACAGGFIRGYNLSDGANVFNLNLSAGFLNGLTSDGVNFLYATDFSGKKIFKIDVANTTFSTIATGLVKTPNGILCEPENNRCLVVNWGTNAPILALDLSTNAITTVLATTLGNCDGITKDSCGNYYITAWSNNKLNKFDASLTGTFTVVPSTLSSPADIDCRLGATIDTIGVPGGGNVTFIDVAKPTVNIALSNNILGTTALFNSYQWFLDQNIIAGAISQNYTPTTNGNYYCQTTRGTCVLDSNSLLISNLGNENFNIQNSETIIYPNPATEKLTFESKSSTKIEYTIYDLSGKVLIKDSVLSNTTSKSIDVSGLNSGYYFLNKTQDGVTTISRFLKN